jgi:phosphopentomutase
MDSVGVGELPDAAEYGDRGANTLGNAARAVGGLSLPNLESLGLGQLVSLRSGDYKIGDPRPAATSPLMGSYGKMAELAKGKDTTTGHWEMMGVVVDRGFPTYPDGFPADLLGAFEKAIGRKTLGNKTASGTEIIKELGEEHCRTGSPIVYTSADSVFQVAAHEEIIPLEELYRICKVARGLLTGPHAVGRVIARPFVGKPGSFARTHHRHDYSLEPFSETLLDRIKAAGLPCVSVGKIWDIFAGRGLTQHLAAGPNAEVMRRTLEGVKDPALDGGLLFANLVDFDMLFNHRQDPVGLAHSLVEFDRFLPDLFDALRPDDLLLITADHGNDPTDNSTDHCREYVPILAYGKSLVHGKNLGVRKTFADCGQTIAEVLGIKPLSVGKSFFKELLVR